VLPATRSRVLAWSRGRARARALGATALALASTLIAGCGAASTGNSSVTVSGKTLSIYLSAPAGAAANPQVQDVLDAEQLAWTQHAQEVTAFKVQLKPITAAKLSDNGRTAISDTKAIAYLGEIVPGNSADSAGITNAQDLLTVSPTDTALELTQKTAAISDTPNRYYESLSTYGKTFARVVPSGAAEAKAQVQEMKALGVKQLAIANDGSPYGAAIALAVKQAAAPSITVATSPSGADGFFYGSDSPATAAHAFSTAAAANPNLKLFGPSALDSSALVSALGSAKNVYISSPGFLPANLTPAGQQFVSAFKSTYHHTPASGAIFGYEAMSAVLGVLHEAGAGANDRQTVVKDFFALRNPPSSVLGSYAINASGDTSAAPFVFSRLKAGALVPFAFVQPSG
jgi:ABC-type branched-subunit amino acid transport system substrate-binding protein